MKKRLVSILLVLSVLASLGNLPVLAAGLTNSDAIQSTENLGDGSAVPSALPALQSGSASTVADYTMNFYTRWEGNNAWIGGNIDLMTTDASGDGWEWYANATESYQARTLVLKGLDFTTSASTGIQLFDDSTIVLKEGTVNHLTIDAKRKSVAYGISGYDLTITGEGTLNIQCINSPTVTDGLWEDFNFSGISTHNLDIKSGTINVDSVNHTSAAVFTNGTNNASVTAGKYSARAAIYISNIFSMTGGTLTLTRATNTKAQTWLDGASKSSATSEQYAQGIYADGAIDLQGGSINVISTISNYAYRGTGQAHAYGKIYAIYCKNGDIVIEKNGTCNITVNVTNDAVNAGANRLYPALISSYCYGLYTVNGNIENQGDTRILFDISNLSNYRYASGTSTLSKVTSNATGMQAENIDLTDGTTSITVNSSGHPDNYPYGGKKGTINHTNNGVTLDTGKLSITSGSTEIYAQNPIVLSGANDSSAVHNANLTLCVTGEEKGTVLNKPLLFNEAYTYHWKTDPTSTEYQDSQDLPYQWKAADQFLELMAYTPLPAPNLSFSFVGADANKLMRADSTMEYSLDGGSTYTPCSDNMDLTDVYEQITAENGIRVRLKKTDSASASLAYIISVTQPDSPKDLLVSDAPSITGTGSITGVTEAMEYRKAGETEYTPCTADSLTDLPIGEYQIRVQAGALSLPSDDTSVTVQGLVPVPSAGAKTYTGTTLTSDLIGTEVYKVTKNDGGIDCADYEVCITLNSNLYRWADSESPDKTLQFTIKKAKASVPSVLEICYDTESLNASANTQYQTAAGTWTNCTETMSLSSLGWDGTERTLLFRTAEDQNHYISDEVSVVLPARPTTPTAADFTVTKTTGTAENGALAAVKSASYEYRINNSADWTDWSGSALTGISGDTVYTIRLRSGEANFHSDEIQVKIQYGPKTDVSSQITFPDAQAIYNGAVQSHEKASTIDPSGGIWSYTYTAQSGKGLSADGKPQNVGTYVVTAHYESDRAVGSKDAEFTILPKELTAVVSCAGKVYDGSRDANVAIVLDGTVQGDSVAANYATALYHTSGAETGKTVTVEGIALSGEAASNYRLLNSTAECTADITKAVLTGGTAQQGSGKDYDGLTEFSDIPINYRGSVAGEVVTGHISGTVPEARAGSYNQVTVTSQVIDAIHAQNYILPSLTDLTGTVTIRKIIPRMTITAPASQTEGQDILVTVKIENPEVTSGFPSADKISLRVNQNAVLKTELHAVDGMPGQYKAVYTLPAYDSQIPENNKVLVMAGLPNDTANYQVAVVAATREIEITKKHSSIYYTITAEAGAGGNISPKGSGAFRAGLNATFTITPNTGYLISDVTVDGTSVGSVDTYTFKAINKAHAITASFRIDPQSASLLPFHDVAVDHWSYQNVMYVLEQGLMNGTNHTMFSPDLCASRGMIVTMLYRLGTQPQVSGTCQFSDVHPQSYYADAVTWAVDTGIASGYKNGVFGPDDVITREQLAVLLFRYAKQQGYAGSVSGDTNFYSYSDAETVSAYAADAMRWACDTGLMVGDNQTLKPKAGAIRAQVAAIFHRFCENVMKAV